MIEIPTVLVLGAGASMPYGFPSTWDLYHDVARMPLDAFPTTEDRYSRTKMFRTRKISEFKAELATSGVKSIDTFLERRKEFHKVGKASIAWAMCPYEANSQSYSEGRRDTNWYRYLWERMHGGVSLDDLARNKLAILTFNYDRSLEHFLFGAAKAYYGAHAAKCAQVLKQIDVVHLHGSIGQLPWQSGKGQTVSYGRGRTFEAILIAMSRIKIASGNSADDPEFVRARELLKSAERVYFLGFGYHPDNLARLGLDEDQWTGSALAGTCHGLGSREIADIRERCSVDISVDRTDMDCLTFFRECHSLA